MEPGTGKPTQLSPNFTLEELTASGKARQYGINNSLPREKRPNARGLCRDLAQPIRDRWGRMKVTSGYRCPKLNPLIGGAKYSAHLYQVRKLRNGKLLRKAAMDFQPMAKRVTLQEVFDWIRFESGLPFDQLILERGKDNNSERDDCIHIAWTNGNPRRQAMLGPTHGKGKYVTVESRDPTTGEAA